jgi:hypothetical protein
MHRMATQKRRVIYLSDMEWAKIGERSEAFGLSRSAYIGKLIEWRQPEADSARDPFREFRPVPKPGRE